MQISRFKELKRPTNHYWLYFQKVITYRYIYNSLKGGQNDSLASAMQIIYCNVLQLIERISSLRLFHPEDCQSKTLGAADLLIDENIDRISSVLRKEIEGNLIIANDSLPGYLEEGKDSLEESFVDAKDDMA